MTYTNIQTKNAFYFEIKLFSAWPQITNLRITEQNPKKTELKVPKSELKLPKTEQSPNNWAKFIKTEINEQNPYKLGKIL